MTTRGTHERHPSRGRLSRAAGSSDSLDVREGGAKAAELERFVEVSSDIYPDLARHYGAEVVNWIDART